MDRDQTIMIMSSQIILVAGPAGDLGGKSGSLFWFSHDQRVVIKSVKPTESRVLQGDFLQRFYRHVTREDCAGPDGISSTLLSRLLGHYVLKDSSGMVTTELHLVC